MNLQEIKSVLPHRYPFLLIDRVECIMDEEIHAVKNVTANEPFFQGHFPEKEIMPGVLQTEVMAQAGALLILSKKEFKGKIAYLTDIERAKFRKMAVPGDVLHISVKLVRLTKNIAKCSGEILIDNKLCASALFTCFIQ